MIGNRVRVKAIASKRVGNDLRAVKSAMARTDATYTNT
jgi:hypothetical protein